MANLTETPTYEAGIYRFETTDPVQGGPGGIDNLPTNQLANRTAWLKAQVEAILLDIAAIESGYATAASLTSHTGNTSNPHAVTKAQVGLGSVENYGVATQAEAEAGTSTTKYMTPLRAKQAIAALVPESSETVAGIIERATAAEAQGMTDTSRAITPATLAEAMRGGNRLLAQSGYQRIPGGLILQWCVSGNVSPGGSGSVSWPIAFPTECLCAFSSPYGNSGNANGANVVAGAVSSVGANIYNWGPILTFTRVFAIGY